MILPEEKDLLAALPYLEKAKKPVLYVGQGTRNGFPQIKEFSEHFSVPIVASVLAKGIIPDDYENFLGFAGRVATKPGNEALAEADLILFVGSDFPFGRAFLIQLLNLSKSILMRQNSDGAMKHRCRFSVMQTQLCKDWSN